MNKKTVALTPEQYTEIISTMRRGFAGGKPNDRIATALMLEANLGLRISDVLALRLSSIIKDGSRRRLDIVEQKTKKMRTFTVPADIYEFMQDYCIAQGIKKTELMFPITERAVQKHLKNVCEYLGYENISTHSFRKFFATEIFKNNNYNIVLVQQLLQHSSPSVTQRYIGISTQEIENALEGHINLL